MTQINLASSFSQYPAGRFLSDGPSSGTRFREELLVPALRQDGNVVVNLDGAMGYGSSFLEEAFGGLVRITGFKPKELRARLSFISTDEPYLVDEIWQYIEDKA